jgi:hypothetical protein
VSPKPLQIKYRQWPAWITLRNAEIAGGCVAALIFVIWIISWSVADSPWKSGDPYYIPFPVHSLVPSGDGRYVVVEVDENDPPLPMEKNIGVPISPEQHAAFTLYIVNTSSGWHRKVGTGAQFVTAAPKGHTFLIGDRRSTRQTVMNGLWFPSHLDVGEYSFRTWDGTGTRIYFEAGWPEHSDGFNVLGIADVRRGTVQRKKLREITDVLGTCPATSHVFVQRNAYRANERADEYDSDGNFLKTNDNRLAIFSPNCVYALPFSAMSPRGPTNWGVYDARSGERLAWFELTGPAFAPQRWFASWNPKYDDLMLLHEGRSERMEAYDVRQQRVLKSWSDRPSDPPVVWAPNGDSVMTVRDHHIVFDPVR